MYVVIKKFQEHCNPKRNLTYERHVFNTRSQGSVETIDAFVTELRLQANNCEFGALRDELIRDRLVVGIQSDSVRSRLLREVELTLQKAIDICRAAEVTDSRMACIQSGGENQINALDRDSKYAKTWAYGKEKIRGVERNLPDSLGLCPRYQKNFPEKLSKIVVDGRGGGGRSDYEKFLLDSIFPTKLTEFPTKFTEFVPFIFIISQYCPTVKRILPIINFRKLRARFL